MSKEKKVYTEAEIKVFVANKIKEEVKKIIELRNILGLKDCSEENISLSAHKTYTRSLIRRIKDKLQSKKKKKKSGYPFWLLHKQKKEIPKNEQ